MMAVVRMLAAERTAVDVALGAGVVAAGLWRDVLRGTGPDFLLHPSPVVVVVAHVTSAVVLVGLRRRRPGACALVLGVLSVLVPSYAVLVVPYSLARYGRHLPAAAACGAVALLGWVVGADVWADGDPVSGVLVAVATASAGLYSRGRAEALARLDRQLLEAARADDRRRVAAGLHDAVTHHVTLVVLQAGALAVRTSDAAVRGEAESIRENGVRALRELGEMVAALSSPTAEPDGPATVPAAPWTRAVEQATVAGQDVAARQVGPDLPAGSPAAVLVDDAVREALANARKHAPGGAVAVHLAVRETGVRLLVRDDGPAEGTWPTGTGAGSGLDRLCRAVTEHGGTMRTTPTPEGGFELEVRLPRSSLSVGAAT